MKCEGIITDRDTQEQHECSAYATHTAYDNPPIPFCDDCLHTCMEDASPEEQSTVKRIP